MVFVKLLAATICFAGNCYPALIGYNTPIGTFHMELRSTPFPGYGGDIIVFAETERNAIAIHRLWLLKPEQKREKRIVSKRVEDHYITNGCINVEPDVYKKLIDCCINQDLFIY